MRKIKKFEPLSVMRIAAALMRILALVLTACVALPRAAWAFAHRLSPEQVREAYFLGRDVEARHKFFDRYIHLLRVHETGLDVHLIEFRTPYELVALRSQKHWANYDVLDAEQDFAKHPDEVVIRVLICDTPMFQFPQRSFLAPGKPAAWGPKDFFSEFSFRVSQAAPIEPERRKLSSPLACSNSGAEVLLYFKADQFAPGELKIDVTEPYGNTYTTTFDLDQLK
jgi:hypothetical protein